MPLLVSRWLLPSFKLLHLAHPLKMPKRRAATAFSSELQYPAGPGIGPIRLAIVGDVHEDYGPEDEAALAFLGVDAALFLGDFGEERVDLVQQISQGSTPRAVILGNHDAWYSLSGALPSYKGARAQLKALGGLHVGYASRTFPAASGQQFCVLGARPFSKGGAKWERVADFYSRMYKVDSMEASAERIAASIRNQAADGSMPMLLIAHNGPTGLGAQAHSICGVDWRSESGDHGDEDLRAALSVTASQGHHIPLVAFGHMHHRLNRRHGDALRTMAHIDPYTGTAYINAAVVPRVLPQLVGIEGFNAVSGMLKSTRGSSWRHFVVTELRCGEVSDAQHVWVEVGPAPSSTHVQQDHDGSQPQHASSSTQPRNLPHTQDTQAEVALPTHSSGGGGMHAAADHEARVVKLGDLQWVCRTAAREGLLRTESENDEVLVRSVFDAHQQQWGASIASHKTDGCFPAAAADRRHSS